MEQDSLLDAQDASAMETDSASPAKAPSTSPPRKEADTGGSKQPNIAEDRPPDTRDTDTDSQGDLAVCDLHRRCDHCGHVGSLPLANEHQPQGEVPANTKTEINQHFDSQTTAAVQVSKKPEATE